MGVSLLTGFAGGVCAASPTGDPAKSEPTTENRQQSEKNEEITDKVVLYLAERTTNAREWADCISEAAGNKMAPEIAKLHRRHGSYLAAM